MKRIFLLLPVLLLTVITANAQVAAVVDTTWWITNNTVRATAVSGNTLYIGCDFTYAGPYCPNGTAVNTTTGAVNLTYARPNGTVLAAVPDGAGGWYIGGSFTTVGNVSRPYIARINADGSLNPWSVSMNSTVRCLVLDGTTLYIGGGILQASTARAAAFSQR